MSAVTTTTRAPATGHVVGTQPTDWKTLVYSYHDWDASLMMRVAWCESNDEAWVVNSYSGATGLFQILVGGSTDAMTNVRQAHALWLIQGYGAWAASQSCWG